VPRWRHLIRLLGPLLAALAMWGTAGASTRYVLTALPLAARPGATIYLSGGGFPPNTQLTIVSECDDHSGKTSGQITIGTIGPTTNGRGQLIAAPFQLPAFSTRGPLWCQYVPSFAGQGKGLVFPGLQIVLPTGYTITPDYLTPTIDYWLIRSHGTWIVQLQSWAGARMHGTIRYFPSHKVQHLAQTLGWQGKVNIRVPAGALTSSDRPATIRVTVTSSFGGYDRSMDACWIAKENSKTTMSRCS
jgi:hypothetical protein